VGEIVTRGLHVMKGYWHDPEATVAAFTCDWLHTGDLGYFDEDGFLFIISRKKELIIRGGYNVYPSEIENVLHAHPAIAEAAVVGVPDERLGEEVMAVIVLRLGMELAERDLVSYCRGQLAAYKCPRVYQFRSELPKNTLGKVLKDELVRMAIARPRGVRISVAILSYVDTVSFGVTADYDSTPDLDVFVEGILRSLAELGNAVLPVTGRGCRSDGGSRLREQHKINTSPAARQDQHRANTDKTAFPGTRRHAR
jgi:hypothetical protein